MSTMVGWKREVVLSPSEKWWENHSCEQTNLSHQHQKEKDSITEVNNFWLKVEDFVKNGMTNLHTNTQEDQGGGKMLELMGDITIAETPIEKVQPFGVTQLIQGRDGSTVTQSHWIVLMQVSVWKIHSQESKNNATMTTTTIILPIPSKEIKQHLKQKLRQKSL